MCNAGLGPLLGSFLILKQAKIHVDGEFDGDRLAIGPESWIEAPFLYGNFRRFDENWVRGLHERNVSRAAIRADHH